MIQDTEESCKIWTSTATCGLIKKFKMYWFVWSKRQIASTKNFHRTCHTEEPWKVLAKTESWFSNQSPKNWWISFQQARRDEFSKFIGSFFPKSKLPQPKILTRVWFCENKGTWKFWAKAESWFPNQEKAIWWISSQQARRVEFSNFISLFFSKPQTTSTKSFNRSLILWQWRAMKILGENFIVVSKSAPTQKLGEYLSSSQERSNFKILLVCFV